jgi:hypothetical protein
VDILLFVMGYPDQWPVRGGALSRRAFNKISKHFRLKAMRWQANFKDPANPVSVPRQGWLQGELFDCQW